MRTITLEVPDGELSANIINMFINQETEALHDRILEKEAEGDMHGVFTMKLDMHECLEIMKSMVETRLRVIEDITKRFYGDNIPDEARQKIDEAREEMRAAGFIEDTTPTPAPEPAKLASYPARNWQRYN